MKKFLLVLIYMLLPLNLIAAVPATLTHQGYLTDSSGVAISGSTEMTFSLYSVETGGTAIWSETQTAQVNNGVYAVALGSVSPLDPGQVDGDLWLGVTVGTDSEMTPRQKLSSVAFALRASEADAVALASVTDANLSGDIDATRIPAIAQLQTLVSDLQQQVVDLNSVPVVTILPETNYFVGLSGTASLSSAVEDSDAGQNGKHTYLWSLDSSPGGSTSSLSQTTGSTTSFVPDLVGEYVISLTVTDPLGAVTTVTKTVYGAAGRFQDNGDGTVTDLSTGIVWLQDIGCSDIRSEIDLTILFSGVCGLSDGSASGDWRLPTLAEMQEILNPLFTPQLPNFDETGSYDSPPTSWTGSIAPGYYVSETTGGINDQIDINDGTVESPGSGWASSIPIRFQ